MFAKASLRSMLTIAAAVASCHAAISQLDVMNTAASKGITKMTVAQMRTTFNAPAYQPNLAKLQGTIAEVNKKHPPIHATSDSAYKCDKACPACVTCVRAGRQLALDGLYLVGGAMATCLIPLVDEAVCVPALAGALAAFAKEEAEFCINQDQPIGCADDCSFAKCAATASTTKKTARGMLALEFSA